jgi:hypothetical protein
MWDFCGEMGGVWGGIGSKMVEKLQKSAHGEP